MVRTFGMWVMAAIMSAGLLMGAPAPASAQVLWGGDDDYKKATITPDEVLAAFPVISEEGTGVTMQVLFAQNGTVYAGTLQGEAGGLIVLGDIVPQIFWADGPVAINMNRSHDAGTYKAAV